MQQQGIESLHAAMPRNMKTGRNDAASLRSLVGALTGNPVAYRVPPNTCNRKGKASGILVGGNLSVLFSLRGTDWDIDTRDRILFLEDLNEYLYHIDRMMTNLLLGGKLQQLKGLVVGGMTHMKSSASGFRRSACSIIREAVMPFGFPVMFGAPSGHIRPNKALIFGRQMEMDVGDEQGILLFKA
jgi:muramoyltetrapeptide carboxypeptidase